jgi:hypothetical protein
MAAGRLVIGSVGWGHFEVDRASCLDAEDFPVEVQAVSSKHRASRKFAQWGKEVEEEMFDKGGWHKGGAGSWPIDRRKMLCFCPCPLYFGHSPMDIPYA